MTNLKANVTAFHLAIDVPIEKRPCVPDGKIVRLRASLIAEECLETIAAMFNVGSVQPSAYEQIRTAEAALKQLIETAQIQVDLGEVADGLADIEYVCEGAFLAFGIDSGPIHAEVQRTNMLKKDGPINEFGKRGKPPGWVGPDIAGIIRKQQGAG